MPAALLRPLNGREETCAFRRYRYEHGEISRGMEAGRRYCSCNDVRRHRASFLSTTAIPYLSFTILPQGDAQGEDASRARSYDYLTPLPYRWWRGVGQT